MMPQQYCLRWKHHHTNVQNMFAQLLEKERFCDVTLYCSPSFATQVSGKDTVEPHHIRGVSLRAHRVVLAACSELLGGLLGAHEAQGEPVLVIDGAEPKHLKALLDYMYTGEMNVHHSQLASLLKTAEELRIKGLTDIRWNNKDEPPDSDAGNIITTTTASPIEKSEKVPKSQHTSPKHSSPKQQSPKHSPVHKKRDDESEVKHDKFSFNGGPPLPPLIKLPTKDKTNSHKRERCSDSDSPSPKRHRLISGTEHIDDDLANQIKLENSQEWQHGNLDISAERVVGWGMTTLSRGSASRDVSDEEWADAPTDIGSFLHTKLSVDGDNSADDESNESVPQTAGSSSSVTNVTNELRVEMAKAQLTQLGLRHTPPTSGPKSGPTDPRFTDVVKLSDYLQHGRRPQFWEENYVKRVMESVRLKELEMKQAAEILGVSYGTLYGRYRDVYGCINRPYRAVRDFWQAKGPSEVLDRLQRGEMSLDSAAQALGVSMGNLAAHLADFGALGEKEFEPIPIEMDPSLKARSRTYSSGTKSATRRPTTLPDKPTAKKVVVGNVSDEESIPATVISTQEVKPTLSPASAAAAAISGKWPTIRVASLDTLRGSEATSVPPVTTTPVPASPSALMRNRPDLTIVAKRPTDKKEDDAT